MVGLMAYKTAWKEGKPGLALLCASHAAISQALAMLAARHPRLYARHRESFVALALFNLTWVVKMLALHGGTVIVQFHGGSALKLLALMVTASSAIWIFFYTLYARMVVAWAIPVLPALAVLPLAGNHSVCRRQLSMPGVPGPLATLHDSLTLTHLAAAPAANLLTGGSESPLFQCMAVNAWIHLFLGLLLPLFGLLALEQQSRRMFDELQRRQQQEQQQQQRRQQQYGQGQAGQAGQPGPSWQAQHRQEASAAGASGSRDSAVQLRQEQWLAEGRATALMPLGLQAGDRAAAGEGEDVEVEEETAAGPLVWVVQLYFSSCIAWFLANVLALFALR